LVDIHTHVLPGLDDGARTLEEAIAMARLAAEDGTTDMVATPHADLIYSYDPSLVDQKIAELSQACGNLPRIHRGCDFHLIPENIQDAMHNPTKYTIAGRNYLLVEFSDMVIPRNIGDILMRLADAGLVPVVTHPERNPLLAQQHEEIASWVARGILIQVTAQSFFGRFGRSARRMADELMRRGLVHFVASDAHDTRSRPPLLAEAHHYVAKNCGTAFADAVLRDNPRAAIAGEPLPARLEARPKGWRSLF
jgi:protein-tyrosine phosphatase